MNKLKTFILTKSDRGNRYVYDRKKNSNLLCNPVLHHILQLVQEGTDIRKWIDNLESDPVEIENCGVVAKGDLEYYYKKYLFLKKKEFFIEPEIESFPQDPIKPEFVEYSLANSRQVTFEVTERCSLNCKYCGYGHFYNIYDKRKGTDMDIDVAIQFLTYLVKYWNSPLNVSHGKTVFISFYGGEPLENIKFIKEIVRFAKNLRLLHNQVRFSMTTNALLLEKYMDIMVDNNFNLLISLDGNKKNNSYRIYKNGKPVFDDILRNINALRDNYPDYFRDKVNFNAVLHDMNSVSEIHDFFKENFDKIPRIGQLKNIGIKNARQSDFWKMYSSINESLYNNAKKSTNVKNEMFIELPDIKNLSIFLLKHSGFVYEDYRHLLSPVGSQKQSPTGTCNPFSRRIFVTANGKLLPCETIAHQFYLGKVKKDNVELDFIDVAQKYNTYFKKMLDQCNRCYYKEACGSCIFNLMFVDNNPVCDDRMDHSRFSRYLSAHISQFEKEPKLYSKIMEEVTLD
jgi:uncharacterized protein